MQIAITTWAGTTPDGVLINVSGPTMRVAVHRLEDVVGFYFRGRTWFSEKGEPVEIEPYSGTGEADLDPPLSLEGSAVGGVTGTHRRDRADWLN